LSETSAQISKTRLDIEAKINDLDRKSTDGLKKNAEGYTKDSTEKFKKIDSEIKGVFNDIKIFRADIVNRIGRLSDNPSKGGSPNQQINVNSSVMSTKYADFNFVSDSAISWSATDDNANRRVNIRASVITGGGAAPGSGITRSTSIISVDTTGGNSASTDYVYFANVGLSFTLPTAVGNNNLYTVKNVSASSVLVISGEGIDDSPSALMPVNYESLSFISNSSVWGVV